jgi:hypothetical protein
LLCSAWASIPAGYYYFSKNKKKAALKTSLHDHAAPLKLLQFGSGAGATWEGFFYTDQRPDTSVYDMYSSIKRYFTGFTAVKGMNIEHSFPKSWWGGSEMNAYRDLFHLYPADGITNSTKNDLPLGVVAGTPLLDNGVSKVGTNGFESAYSGNCFEPADEYKGDFARSYFYIASVYEDYAPLWNSPMLQNNTYPVWQPWAIDLLLKWSREDPVSDKERARNEAVYQIQGNRNPFIDLPDLAEYIWGNDTTSVYPFADETEPYMLAPRQGDKLDFGVILQGNSKSISVNIQGINLTSPLVLTKKNSTFTLSASSVSPSDAATGIDLLVSFNPSAAGVQLDTLVIQGGGLAAPVSIPVRGVASSEFMALPPTDETPVGGTLQWIADPQATDYRVNLYQGDLTAGDLFISTYVEGSSYNKAIEIYNGTGKTVDLSKYSLQRQSNGAGEFNSVLKLTGTLADGKSYIVIHQMCATTDLKSKGQCFTDSVMNFNGNDAVELLHNGVVIDAVGYADAGAALIWGQDITLQRKAQITHPRVDFDMGEWTTYPVDTYSMLGSHSVMFASASTYQLQNVSTGGASFYTATGLTPQSYYTFRIDAVKAGGNVTAVNTVQLHTTALDVPVVMQPVAVGSHQFTAGWEQTLFAQDYLLDVYTLTGQLNTTEKEEFNSVTTNGKPLPDGWSGTASGNYTTTASSGNAPPSVGLKNNNEWLQTKQYSYPVSSFSFMYRFASTGTGSSLLLDALSNGSWVRVDSIPYVNTGKTTPSYTFNKSASVKALRFTYKKVSGNMAIDDVQATYGNQDTLYIAQERPVTANSCLLDNLTENTVYYYKVRARTNNVASAYSDLMQAVTTVASGLLPVSGTSVRYTVADGGILLRGLQGNETISVYTVTGICLKSVIAGAEAIRLNMPGHGIAIVRIKNSNYATAFKVVR